LPDILLATSPVLILLVFAVIVLVVDIAATRVHMTGRPPRPVSEPMQTPWLPYLALAGLLLSLLAAFIAVPAEDRSLFGGMVAVDGFARFFAIVVCVTVGLVVLSAIDYFKTHRNAGEFYVLLLLAAVAIMLVASSTNLIMIFLSLEFLTLVTAVLVCYLYDNQKSTEAAIKFFLFSVLSAAVLLYGLSFLFGLTGRLDLPGIASGLAGLPEESLRWGGSAALIFIIAGLGFKIAAVPFHQWAPDAYEGAPTPVTAFISVASKAAGIAILARLMLTVFDATSINWTAALAVLSLLTMTLGNLVAIVQKDMKRLFAYSSIANMGYVLIGLAAVGPQRDGLAAVLIYIFGYIFTNLGVFAIIMVMERSTGTTAIAEYAGLARRSPALALGMVVFMLSLIGFPSTAGFIGKFFVFAAAVNNNYLWLAIAGVINSAISVYYYFNIVRLMFFQQQEDATRAVAQTGLLQLVWVVSVALTFLIGLFPQPLIELVRLSSKLFTGV
jgi:proton-translocating NADH-quinone oxidoreductase chain N